MTTAGVFIGPNDFVMACVTLIKYCVSLTFCLINFTFVPFPLSLRVEEYIRL